MHLNENERYEKCRIYENGEAIIVIEKLDKGDIKKEIVLIKKENGEFSFKRFNNKALNNVSINNIYINENNFEFVINTSKGSYCYDFKTLNQLWKYEGQEVIHSINTDSNEWILGGRYTTVLAFPNKKVFDPIFASSFDSAITTTTEYQNKTHNWHS